MSELLRQGRLRNKVLLKEQNRCCDNCEKKEGPLQLCSRCKVVKYCCKECQKTAWPTHRTECQELAAIRQEGKDVRKQVKQQTGKSTADQTKAYEEMVSKIQSMDRFDVALRSVAHMVSTGECFPILGITEPSHMFFKVNMSAWDVFTKSDNASVRRAFVVTCYPPEMLQGVLDNESVFAKVKEQQAKTPCMSAFMWQAKPDRYEGDFAMNSILTMPYTGSVHMFQEAGVDSRDPRVYPMLKANHLRNCFISQNLAPLGVLITPPEVSDIIMATSPPDWDLLSKNKTFQRLVEQNPFGILGGNTEHTTGGQRSFVTLFVNTLNLPSIVDQMIEQMNQQLPGDAIERMVIENEAQDNS